MKLLSYEEYLKENQLMEFASDDIELSKVGFKIVQKGNLYGIEDVESGELIVPYKYTWIDNVMNGSNSMVQVKDKSDKRRALEVIRESKKIKSVSSSMRKYIEVLAKSCYDEGFKCEINHKLPWISVEKNGKSLYFAQGDDASNLLDECPPNVSEKDYVMFMLKNIKDYLNQ